MLIKEKQYINQIFLDEGERIEIAMRNNSNFNIILKCEKDEIQIEEVPYIQLMETIVEWKLLHQKNKADK